MAHFYWLVEGFWILHLSFFSFFRDHSASWLDSRLRGTLLSLWLFFILTACNHDFLGGDSTLCPQDLSFLCVRFI
jgi:hypothetical protein